jgi:hypothetical protein
MNRKKAQLLLLAIMIPIVLSAAYSVYSIWNGYRPSLELILGVGGSLVARGRFEAHLAYTMVKRGYCSGEAIIFRKRAT